MTDTVSWILMLHVKDGQLPAFRSLMDEMVESTLEEPGAMIYEFWVSDDESTVHIYERYADSQAVLSHLGSFGENFGEQFFACVDPIGFHVYGEPDDTARTALAGAGASFLGPLGGFAR